MICVQKLSKNKFVNKKKGILTPILLFYDWRVRVIHNIYGRIPEIS